MSNSQVGIFSMWVHYGKHLARMSGHEWLGWAHRHSRAVQAPDALNNAVCPAVAGLHVGCLDQVQDAFGS